MTTVTTMNDESSFLPNGSAKLKCQTHDARMRMMMMMLQRFLYDSDDANDRDDQGDKDEPMMRIRMMRRGGRGGCGSQRYGRRLGL